jgi:hypothetical protein
MPEMRVTLNGIKRRGLANWRAREQWLCRQVWIWSAEHRAWWGSGRCGYFTNLSSAGVYNFAEAYDATKHCGPEKRIEFIAVPEGKLPLRFIKGQWTFLPEKRDGY